MKKIAIVLLLALVSSMSMLWAVDEPTQSSRENRKSLQGSIGFLIEDVGSDHTLLYGITGGATERIYKTQVVNTTTDPVNTKAVS